MRPTMSKYFPPEPKLANSPLAADVHHLAWLPQLHTQPHHLHHLQPLLPPGLQEHPLLWKTVVTNLLL